MSEDRPSLSRISEICDHAEKLHGSEQGQYLDQACGSDISLRAEVESLLQARASQGGFLSNPTRLSPDSEEDTADFDSVATTGQMIGRYKLLEQLGEGGFGSVWVAEQRKPVKRRVAIKVIKLGMDTKQVVARFEAERQALAMMDHPNIAKVLDAGSTDSGRPFFVMELVRGVPILEYCDAQRLDTRARLHLFTQVCQAIHHAHQKGIIHRDIKPSNVMITLHDGEPVVKVIDFGIAKATNAELTEKTLYTQYHQLIGTPTYMSPEQAEYSGLDIDTRSDIYSLGVLLYEMLTGTTPLQREQLLSAGYAAMILLIKEQVPQKPSTRVSTLGVDAESIAMKRSVDASRLGTLLRGDLDWILMKCLEKDRARRYDSATALAADIQRHLGRQPVAAGPPTLGYRLLKYVSRHRGQVAAIGLVAVTLVIALAGTSAGLIWALHEKEEADSQSAIAQAESVRADERTLAAKKAESAERESRMLAEALAYSATLGRAELALKTDRLDEGRAAMASAPASWRGWEWHLLDSLLDESDREVPLRGRDGVFSKEGDAIITTLGFDNLVFEPTIGWRAKPAQSSFPTEYHHLALNSTGNVAIAYREANRSGLQHSVRFADFDPRTGLLRREFGDSEFSVGNDSVYTGYTAALSEDGKVFACMFQLEGGVAGPFEDLVVFEAWNVADGTLISRRRQSYWIPGDEPNLMIGPNSPFALSRDGSLAAILRSGPRHEGTASPRSPARVALVRTKDLEVIHLWTLDFATTQLQFAGDSDRIYAGLADGSIWQLEQGSSTQMVHPDSTGTRLRSMAVSTDENRFAYTGDDQRLRIYDHESKKTRVFRGLAERIEGVRFDHAGDRVLTFGSSSSRIDSSHSRVWTVSTPPIPVNIWSPINAKACVSANGEMAFTTGSQILHRPPGTSIPTLWDRGAWPSGFSIFDASTLAPIGYASVPEAISCIAASESGRTVVLGTETGKFYVAQAGVSGLQQIDPRASTAKFDRVLATRCIRGTTSFVAILRSGHVIQCDWSSGDWEMLTEVGDCNGADLSVDGSTLAVTSTDRIAVYDLETSTRIWHLDLDALKVAVCFDRSGRRIAAGVDDAIYLWDLHDSNDQVVLRGHRNDITGLQFNSDGTRLASGSLDQTVRIWDSDRGLLLTTLDHEGGGGPRPVWSTDGQTLLVGGGAMGVECWQVGSAADRRRRKERGDALRIELAEQVSATKAQIQNLANSEIHSPAVDLPTLSTKTAWMMWADGTLTRSHDQ